MTPARRRERRAASRAADVVTDWAKAGSPIARLSVASDHLRAAAKPPHPDQGEVDRLVEETAVTVRQAGDRAIAMRAARAVGGAR